MHAHGRLIPIAALLGGFGMGCAGEVGLSDPPPGGSDQLRPGLTVRVEVVPEAAAVAAALGWTDGVPGAEVRVHRIGTDFAWETAVTDDRGAAHLPHLAAGRYRVAAYRPLTDAEAARAGVSVLAAGGIVHVGGSGTERTMALVPNRTGSLVFSEVYAPSPLVAELDYNFHMYFELYNNSTRTVFLDGLTFGRVRLHDIATPDSPCAESARLRKDPDGVWTEFLHRFPGRGSDHPLAPGETAVVALDAVDHSVIDPRLPDLSDADFELLGNADVDNPAVPNLVEVGLRPWFHGHGLLFYHGHSLFVARHVDAASLHRSVDGDATIIRIAATDLIDVVWVENAEAFQDQLYERCDGIVHGDFDQLGGGFVSDGSDLSLSVQRILLPGAAGAAGQLQDTNVSAVDLTKGTATPGTIPLGGRG